ncbi:MAG: hypothetical protein GX446_10765 [Chthonomonadales bacterium]|nr:hypothetical protein [Chthonomonadales bacterium]
MLRTHRGSVIRTLACLLAGSTVLGLTAGCRQKEPEPTVPGYYTGPIKPKGEVAPGPATGGAKAGVKGEAASDK